MTNAAEPLPESPKPDEAEPEKDLQTAPDSGTSAPESGPGGLGNGAEDADRELVKAANAGDSRAFEELVKRHQDRVYTRIFFMVHHRETAADLTQDAFLKAYMGLKSFRGEALFSTWLNRIAVNVTLHHFEKQGAQKRSANVISLSAARGDMEETQMEIPDSTHLPDEWAQRSERQRAILEAVADLDPEYRTALALRELQGCSYREIEELLGVPIGTVKSKIFRARQMLQEKLKGIL